MNTQLLIDRIKQACTLEEEFLSDFPAFLSTLDSYAITAADKQFIGARIQTLFDESKQHLHFFTSMLENVRGRTATEI